MTVFYTRCGNESKSVAATSSTSLMRLDKVQPPLFVEADSVTSN